MRDDRYKSAPTPACWRRFMRRLFREADRIDASRLAEWHTECLAIDLREQLSREVIDDLSGRKPVLPGIGLPTTANRTALVADIDARILALPPGSTSDERLACAHAAVREYDERWGRELNAHVSAERYPDGREIMRAYDESVRLGCAPALDRVLGGAKTAAPKDTVDLEANLLPRRPA